MFPTCDWLRIQQQQQKQEWNFDYAFFCFFPLLLLVLCNWWLWEAKSGKFVGLRLLYTEDIMLMLCLYVFSSLGVISIAQQSFFTSSFIFCSFLPSSIVVVSIAALFIPPLDDYCFGVLCGKVSRMSWVENKGKICRNVV